MIIIRRRRKKKKKRNYMKINEKYEEKTKTLED